MSATEQSNTAMTTNTAEQSASGSRPSVFKRFGSILENKNVQTGARFFSASAKTWLGMHPIWLMGEAVTGRVSAARFSPTARRDHVGLTATLQFQKVGTQFKKSGKELLAVAEELRAGIATSTCGRFFGCCLIDSLTDVLCDHYAVMMSLSSWIDICRRRRAKQSRQRRF